MFHSEHQALYWHVTHVYVLHNGTMPQC